MSLSIFGIPSTVKVSVTWEVNVKIFKGKLYYHFYHPPNMYRAEIVVSFLQKWLSITGLED
jgi:hypothetical protein